MGEVLKGAVDAVGVVAPEWLAEDEAEEERSERVPVKVPVSVRRKIPIIVCLCRRKCVCGQGLDVQQSPTLLVGLQRSRLKHGQSLADGEKLLVSNFQCNALDAVFADQ